MKQPTAFTCGQTCLAMITKKSVEDICLLMGTKRSTTISQVSNTLNKLGYIVEPKLTRISKKNPLPELAIVKLRKQNRRGKWMNNWHWTVYCNGEFFDPSWGVVKEYILDLHRMRPVSFMKVEKLGIQTP